MQFFTAYQVFLKNFLVFCSLSLLAVPTLYAKPGKGGGGKDGTDTGSSLTISVQPQELSVNEFDSASFSVSANSNRKKPIRYQWYFNGAVLTGQTGQSLSIASASVSNEGVYWAIATQGDSSVVSDQVGLTVTPAENPNRAPVAQDDFSSTFEDTSIVLSPLANDADPDGDILSIISATASIGRVELSDTENLTYYPPANYHGNASIAYSIVDPSGSAASANISLTVHSVNDVPVAEDDSSSTDQGRSIAINVLANDSDIDGDALVVVDAFAPNGNVQFDQAGSLFYTPNGGYVGADTIDYTVSDGVGGYAYAKVFVQVNEIEFLEIVAQPIPANVDIGSTHELKIVAEGSGELTYQWRKDGVPLTGASNQVLRFDALTETDSGAYDVIVSNSTGSLASESVLLTAVHLPSIDFTWEPPQYREDGSPIDATEIEGFNLYVVGINGEEELVVPVSGTETTYSLDGLSRGEYVFYITTIDSNGNESNLSDGLLAEL